MPPITRPAHGLLLLSIDLAMESDRRDVTARRSLDRAGGQLLNLLRAYGLPATWAVADPLRDPSTEAIRAANPRHDIALRANVESTRSRAALAGGLSRRVLAARAAGVDVTTLVAPRPVDAHLDLLLKHGLTALRIGPVAAHAAAPVEPRGVRFGLWEMPVTATLPHPGGWRGRVATLQVGRALRQAVRRGRTCHLAIDAARLAKLPPGEAHAVEQLLRLVARLRDRAGLEIATLAEAAARLSERPSTTPARSILRPAG